MEPKHNSEYLKQEYWNSRFAKEDEYEWLVSFADCKDQLLASLPEQKDVRILIIGCGNSSLGFDLHTEGGFTNIDNIDYSDVVIERMKAKHVEQGEQLRWHTMDMMQMTFEDGLFDVVIDKATMDVIVTDNKDPWNPSDEVKERAKKVVSNVHRVLKSNGRFVQISFDQPHFRKKYLLEGGIQWKEFSQKSIDKGLGFFMYIMDK